MTMRDMAGPDCANTAELPELLTGKLWRSLSLSAAV